MNKYTLNELLDFGIPETRARRFLRGIEKLTPADVSMINKIEYPVDTTQTEGPKVFDKFVIVARKNIKKNCKICDKKFTVKSGAEKFCSLECRHRADVLREISYGKNKRAARMMELKNATN